jgi:diguanylate cyclase (GGDEF)-like protein/putative nucleotidyltransferase with HDIG domain
MSAAARIYVGSVIGAGVLILLGASRGWSSANPFRFLAFALLTALASGLKLRLPGVQGTMSLSLVLLLSCALQFSGTEVAGVAVLSALIQSFWMAQDRPRLFHLAFNVSVMILSAMTAYAAYHLVRSRSGLILSAACAACGYFLVNTLSVTGAIAFTERKPFLPTWRSYFLWSFPFYLFGATLAASMTFLTRSNWEVGLAVLPLVFIIYRSYTVHLRHLEEEKRHAEAMAALHLRTIETLALAIEAKDQTTADHLRRVQIYTEEISKDLKLPEIDKKALEAASILHDVGKIAVPDYIISKPGRQTPEEFERMKIHPIVGAEIAEQIDFPYPVAPIVRAHHEKWDGSEYPFGLRGDQIPLAARILSVVDCFDALASHRQYRKALPLEQAMAAVAREAGRSFDPAVVEVLARRYLEFEKLAQAAPVRPPTQLSTEVIVERGHSPDAGFEIAALRAAVRPKPHDLFDQCSSRLGMSLNLEETLAVLCSRMVQLVPADAVAVFLLEGDWLAPRYVQGENFTLLKSLRVGLGFGVAGWVAENHKPLLNGNPAVEPGYSSGPKASAQLNSVLAAPLYTNSHTLGVLALYRAGADAFSRDALDDVLAVSDPISLAIEGSLEQERQASAGNSEPITGLPNARALLANIEAQIAKSRVTGSPLIVAYCGVEGLSDVHEAFGRRAAEETLQALARAFFQSCREIDYLAQPGGDDFVFVLPGLSFEAVEQWTGALWGPVQQAGLEWLGSESLSFSIGTSNFPFHGDIPEALVAEAERRMLAARASRDGNHGSNSGAPGSPIMH